MTNTARSELRLERYGFDHVDICEMASFSIVKSSIDNLGKELCAARILSDMFLGGIS